MNNIILILVALIAIIILKYIESTPNIWLLASDAGESIKFKTGTEVSIGKPGDIGL